MIYINGSVPCSLDVGDISATAIYINGSKVFQCTTQSESEPPTPPSYSAQYLTFTALEDGSIEFIPVSSNTLIHSYDSGATWRSGHSVIVNSGQSVMWMRQPGNGVIVDTNYYKGIGRFVPHTPCKVLGNPMSVIYPDFQSRTYAPGFCFASLFIDDGYIMDASNLVLPADTVGYYAYARMFKNCHNLVYPPKIYGETQSTSSYFNGRNCWEMFAGCTSLVKAPELRFTTVEYLGCASMFDGCTSMTEAPSILPATSMSGSCYINMFRNCTSLVKAPVLPATDLSNGQSCYAGMFQGCTSLVTPPALPATTLAGDCYVTMFQGCTSLKSAPYLPATVLASYCYRYMFDGCTSLENAPAILPAPETASYCYGYMFRGCTSLVQAPILPATLYKADNSYDHLFDGCTSLSYIKCLLNNGQYRIYGWVTNVSPTGTFVKAYGSSWPTGNDGIPSGWTVIEE